MDWCGSVLYIQAGEDGPREWEMREMRVTATQTGESVTELIFCEDMSAMDGGGFEVVLDIRDGRTVADVGEEDEVDTIEIVNPLVESQKENTRVSIRPLPGRRNEFTVDFSTRHYAFSCCRSQTVRSLESFYQLHTILKVSLRKPSLRWAWETSLPPFFFFSRRATCMQPFPPFPSSLFSGWHVLPHR